MDHMSCHACKRSVVPEPPHTPIKIAITAFWVIAMVVSTVFSLILLLNIVLVPVAIMVGMAVGTAARRASSWTCPCCKAELMVPAEIATDASIAQGHPFSPVLSPSFIPST